MENIRIPAELMIKNMLIQNNIIISASNINIEKLFFFGSSCMYPKKAKNPIGEMALYGGLLEETSKPYAISKLAGTELCLSLNKQNNNTKFIPLIPATVFGPNDNFDIQKGHVMSSLIRKFYIAKKNNEKKITLWGTGEPRREFIYSHDLAKAIIFLIKLDSDIELPLNIGVGSDISIKSLADIIKKLTNFKGAIEWDTKKPNGTLNKLLDSSRINNLGWVPENNLVNSIEETLIWYKKKYDN